MHVLLLEGPNLNLTGMREPETYGTETRNDALWPMQAFAKELGLDLEWQQHNAEGDLLDKLHRVLLLDTHQGVIINPGGLAHTSVVLRDALRAVVDKVPIIEVHLSNVHKRESFRHVMMSAGSVNGVICGFGYEGYRLAIRAISGLLGVDTDTTK